MNNKNLITFLLCLIQFFCTDRLDVISYNEVEIVRTSRDSTYFNNGSLLTGLVKKIQDDEEILSFSVKYSHTPCIKTKLNFFSIMIKFG